nr:glycine-rich cell wall structural protein 1.0-like [Aegilops tauschii subsp. strangulata]
MDPWEKGEMEGKGDRVGLGVDGGGTPEGAEGGVIGRAGGDLPIQIEQSARERRRTGMRAPRAWIGARAGLARAWRRGEGGGTGGERGLGRSGTGGRRGHSDGAKWRGEVAGGGSKEGAAAGR